MFWLVRQSSRIDPSDYFLFPSRLRPQKKKNGTWDTRNSIGIMSRRTIQTNNPLYMRPGEGPKSVNLILNLPMR